MSGPKTTVTVHCLCCDETTKVVGNWNAFNAWRDGIRKSVDVFRNLDSDTRLALTTLICGPCYRE